MTKQFPLLLVIIGLIFGSLSCTKSELPVSQVSANQAKIQSYVDAYNAHDLSAMAELMHDNVAWFNIEGSSQTIITEDKETLINELESYFSGNPKSVSTLSDWSVNGNYISAKETVSYTNKHGDTDSQASISVYEVEDGLIRRVWYFPAQ